MSTQITPQELAETLLDKVTYYCGNISGDSYYECILNHSPEDLDMFASSYIEEEGLGENLENANNKFWESVKDEYEKLWMEHLASKLAGDLSDIAEFGRVHIVENAELNDDEKKQLLEKYEDVLDELGDAINKALKEQKPLSSDELKDYLLKLYKIAGFRYEYPDDPIDYYMDYYDLLDKAGKLQVLSGFLDGIADVLYDIDEDLKKYNVLEQ